MTERFRDKVALITGGASGIGAATVRRLASEGATIAICDRQADRGAALAVEIGGDAWFQPLDVTDVSGWASAIDAVTQRHGALDVAVLCAGIPGFGSIEDVDASQFLRTMEVNAFGVFLGCKAAVAAMKARGGAIVNVGSTMSVRATPGQLAYGASKAAVLQITRSVAIHCAQQRYGIRCNAVLPGGVETPMLDTMADAVGGMDALRTVMASIHPIGRAAGAEEVAATIAFLASDDASFITAAAYAVDGGLLEA